MKYLFSRYGGQTFIIGKGRASAEKLPQDQSLDYLLDHYATEIIEKVFFISSYDALPEFMGAYEKLPLKAVKIGTVEHDFNDVFLQQDFKVDTAIYVAIHSFSNVFALFIRTSSDTLKFFLGDYKPSYDYVQTTFFRDVDPHELRENPKLMEIMLLILFYKMEIHATDFAFQASKTFLGKRISKEFYENVNTLSKSIHSDADLKQLLENY